MGASHKNPGANGKRENQARVLSSNKSVYCQEVIYNLDIEKRSLLLHQDKIHTNQSKSIVACADIVCQSAATCCCSQKCPHYTEDNGELGEEESFTYTNQTSEFSKTKNLVNLSISNIRKHIPEGYANRWPDLVISIAFILTLLLSDKYIIKQSHCNPTPTGFLDSGHEISCKVGQLINISDYIPMTDESLKRCYACTCPNGSVKCSKIEDGPDCGLPPESSIKSPFGHEKLGNKYKAQPHSTSGGSRFNPSGSSSGAHQIHHHYHNHNMHGHHHHHQLAIIKSQSMSNGKAKTIAGSIAPQQKQQLLKQQQQQQQTTSSPVAQPISSGSVSGHSTTLATKIRTIGQSSAHSQSVYQQRSATFRYQSSPQAQVGGSADDQDEEVYHERVTNRPRRPSDILASSESTPNQTVARAYFASASNMSLNQAEQLIDNKLNKIALKKSKTTTLPPTTTTTATSEPLETTPTIFSGRDEDNDTNGSIESEDGSSGARDSYESIEGVGEVEPEEEEQNLNNTPAPPSTEPTQTVADLETSTQTTLAPPKTSIDKDMSTPPPLWTESEQDIGLNNQPDELERASDGVLSTNKPDNSNGLNHLSVNSDELQSQVIIKANDGLNGNSLDHTSANKIMEQVAQDGMLYIAIAVEAFILASIFVMMIVFYIIREKSTEIDEEANIDSIRRNRELDLEYARCMQHNNNRLVGLNQTQNHSRSPSIEKAEI